MKKIHIDFVIMTIKSEEMRVIIGNRKKFSPIVYTMDMNDGEFGENYYSYCAYLNSLTNEQGLEIQNLIEEKNTRKAHNCFLKYFKEDDCIGPCGPAQLSDLIPDEWFDGCKWAIDMLDCKKMKGVFPCDFEVEDLF
ncbi:MAG: hypothetical protein MJ181_12770 [Treponema sp.]|nr:hypothetical protein [Treponema sp.]